MAEETLEKQDTQQLELKDELKDFINQILSAIDSYGRLASKSAYPEAKHNFEVVSLLGQYLKESENPSWFKVLEKVKQARAELKSIQVDVLDEKLSTTFSKTYFKISPPEVVQMAHVLDLKLTRAFEKLADIQARIIAHYDHKKVAKLELDLFNVREELKAKKAELKKELSDEKEKYKAKQTTLKSQVTCLMQQLETLREENSQLKEKFHEADKVASTTSTELAGKKELLAARDEHIAVLAETKELTKQLILSNQRIAEGQEATIFYLEHKKLPELSDEEFLKRELGDYAGKNIEEKVKSNKIMSAARMKLVLDLMSQHKQLSQHKQFNDKKYLAAIIRLVTESKPMNQIVDAADFRVLVPPLDDKLEDDSARVLKYAALLAHFVVKHDKLAVLILKNQEQLAKVGVQALFPERTSDGGSKVTVMDDDIMQSKNEL